MMNNLFKKLGRFIVVALPTWLTIQLAGYLGNVMYLLFLTPGILGLVLFGLFTRFIYETINEEPDESPAALIISIVLMFVTYSAIATLFGITVNSALISYNIGDVSMAKLLGLIAIVFIPLVLGPIASLYRAFRGLIFPDVCLCKDCVASKGRIV